MIVKLLTEHDLEFLNFKGGCTGSSESTLVKMQNCWKSHATAQLIKAQTHIQSLDIIVLHLVTLPFKTVHFQTFCKNYCCTTKEATNMKKEQNESKSI